MRHHSRRNVKTEGGLITDFRKLCEYTNIRSNVPVEKSVQRLQKTKSSSSNPSSTNCGTRRSVATITRVGDQTFDPNQITTQIGPFTPRTRTQQPSTTTITKIPSKKWMCNEGIEDELASDLSNTIATAWQDITLPTVMPKYPTPIDPVTKLFLKMTSISRWRKRPTEIKCIKAAA
ncbi:hypothetical protein ACI65C_000621 [Semiaphis heraclei]